MKRFFDTCAILNDYSDLSDVVISSVTIKELEHIKTSANKDTGVKFNARQAVKAIKEFTPEVVVATLDDYSTLAEMNLEATNDNLIIACAARYNHDNSIVFITEDYLCGIVAREFFNLKVESLTEKITDTYKGYKVVIPDDDTLAKIYNKDNCENVFDCIINEYVIVKDSEDNTLDIIKWNGEKYIQTGTKPFKSRAFGSVKPLDEIQRCAFDSINSNDITVLYGRAGSGKTTIPLSYISQCIETQKYKKCYIVYHYETLKGAKTLGFIKGDKLEKQLGTSSLGGILASKYGDLSEIQRMIASGMIEIVSTADLRGVEFSDSIVFSTEAQDLDTYALKTLIQRCKTGCKVILEGDIIEQCDTNRGVGLYKMIDIFKGYKGFGCIKLKNNYRSEIAELADKM